MATMKNSHSKGDLEGIENSAIGTLRITIRRRLNLYNSEETAYRNLQSIAAEKAEQPENGIFLENEYVPEYEIRAMIHEEFMAGNSE